MLNLALASSINLVPVESLAGFVLEACRRQKPPQHLEARLSLWTLVLLSGRIKLLAIWLLAGA